MLPERQAETATLPDAWEDVLPARVDAAPLPRIQAARPMRARRKGASLSQGAWLGIGATALTIFGVVVGLVYLDSSGGGGDAVQPALKANKAVKTPTLTERFLSNVVDTYPTPNELHKDPEPAASRRLCPRHQSVIFLSMSGPCAPS